jgi:hypothetical protein
MRRSARLAAIALCLLASTAGAQPAVKLGSVVLFQPDDVVTPRMRGDAQGLADYVKALEQDIVSAAGQYVGPPRTLGVAVVMRPGGQSRLWYAPTPGASADPEVESLYRKAEPQMSRRKPPQVYAGPVGFAVLFSLGGGTRDGSRLPFPPDWQAAVKPQGASMPIEDVWRAVWPEAEARKPAAQEKATAKTAPPPAVTNRARAPKGDCVYKPVMTDEEMARCR